MQKTIPSTTVEITIGYLTYNDVTDKTTIYNSRNYYRLLNQPLDSSTSRIYNSRNYYRLLNNRITKILITSTTVEITIGYLTPFLCFYTIFCLVTIIFDYFFIYFTHIY